ncbi:MAG: hypothetical protein HFH85_05835 [Lachnospiraceae bacterium]|nr:hypothetical protein [Lachnospiraceae bacterium]
MNCFILLLLLGCCGWGNGCSGSGCNGCGMRRNDCCRGNGGRRDITPGCREDRCCERECDQRCESCCEEKPHDHDDCGCGQRGNDNCEGPGMIPPPWQEYPRFPRRDRDEDCCES